MFVTGGVTELLPRLVGLQRARSLMLLGERFDAERALALGIVNRVVPAGQLKSVLGVTDVKYIGKRGPLAVIDSSLEEKA